MPVPGVNEYFLAVSAYPMSSVLTREHPRDEAKAEANFLLELYHELARDHDTYNVTFKELYIEKDQEDSLGAHDRSHLLPGAHHPHGHLYRAMGGGDSE